MKEYRLNFSRGGVVIMTIDGEFDEEDIVDLVQTL